MNSHTYGNCELHWVHCIGWHSKVALEYLWIRNQFDTSWYWSSIRLLKNAVQLSIHLLSVGPCPLPQRQSQVNRLFSFAYKSLHAVCFLLLFALLFLTSLSNLISTSFIFVPQFSTLLSIFCISRLLFFVASVTSSTQFITFCSLLQFLFKSNEQVNKKIFLYSEHTFRDVIAFPI